MRKTRKTLVRVNGLLAAQARLLSGVIAVVLALTVIAAVRHAPTAARRAARDVASSPVVIGGSGDDAAVSASASQAASPQGSVPARALGSSRSDGIDGYRPGTVVPGTGTIPLGIHGDTITVVYYWKGDRTQTSPYLGASGRRGAVDEGEAFRKFVAYVNKHANGDSTFMGFRFNLHGRTIVPIVKDAGQYPETYAATAEQITQEIKPFAALSSHGSLSDYICPALAKAHIFNPVTYNLQANLVRDTGGWCLPQGLAWERQVDLSVGWLARQARTLPYQETSASTSKRIYGLLYAQYPGLSTEVPKLVRRLEAAGVHIAATRAVSPDLTKAAPEQPDVIKAFKAAHVNTIIAPESGSLITFTNAAPANAYTPDYFVWPCSGADTAGQVRLYDAAQWQRASGLSCYDENFNLDLTLDQNARSTEWFRQFREVASSKDDPPSTSPLVYEGMLPILVGLTNAGRQVTMEKFFAGIRAFQPYRYHAVEGPVQDASHLLVSVGAADGSQVGDVAEVRWSNTVTTAGNSTPGAYIYSRERHARASSF